MVSIAIVHHKSLRYTRSIAENIALGAKNITREVKLFTSLEISSEPEILNSYDAIIFGSPTYFGSVSAEMKSFMDSTSQIWLEQKWKNKIAAGFTCANSPSGDQLGTLLQICIFAAQHSMIWVGSDLMPKMQGQQNALNVYNKLGIWAGLGIQVKSASGERINELPQEDIKAAKHFGERIAKVTQQFKQE